MDQHAAQLVVTASAAYYAGGVTFAALFAARLVERLDPAARRATLGFRLIIVPGAAALWPYLLLRLARGASAPPDEWTAHRVAVRRTAKAGAR